MIRRFTVSLFALAWLITIASAQTPPGVQIKLAFAENKTVYRIGEPIKLVMEFMADREGYQIEITPDGSQPGMDNVVVSPDIGITRWFDEFSDNGAYGRHSFAMEKLTTTPKRIELVINDRLRFDSAGQYTVSVTTRRLSPGSLKQALTLSTNSLTFEIAPMSEADEAKEVKRLSELLDTRRNPQTDYLLSQQLSYLTGDPSTREKVRRYFSQEQRGGSYLSHIWQGLFIARNRTLVLKLVEERLRDASIPVTLDGLATATRLKTLITHGVREKEVNPPPGMLEREPHPHAREIQDAYIAEVAAGLGKRTGENQTTTAVTILISASANSPTTTPGVREARRILVQQFDTLQPYTKEWLLRTHWETLREASLISSLKKMLADPGRAAKSSYPIALTRLMEIAPGEARPYVIAQIREPASLVDAKTLGALEDKSLPEVDAVLLEQIRQAMTSTQNSDRIYLKSKLHLLVRFATDSHYQELMELYRTAGEKLEDNSRAGFLAYFAKHNEREAIPLIENVVSEFKPGQNSWVLAELTALYYSDAIGAILKRLLETDDYAHASHAAYLIRREGTAGDERLLEARLKRWREEWRYRVAEADAQHQGQLERELIHGLIYGKSWKLPPEQIEALKKSCITKLCKESNLVRQ